MCFDRLHHVFKHQGKICTLPHLRNFKQPLISFALMSHNSVTRDVGSTLTYVIAFFFCPNTSRLRVRKIESFIL